MLLKLVLENFQAHKELRIDLDPAVTVIVGPTDVGKSAVFRALRWVSLNRPTGDEFVRFGADPCVVYVTTDQTLVRRARGKGLNLYTVGRKESYQEYKAMGNSVPEDVSAVLKLSDLNFQGQMDTPYWFGESASAVSRMLNEIVDLSAIDTLTSVIASRLRRARERLAVCAERLSAAKQARAAAREAEEMDEDLRAVERTEEQLLRVGGEKEDLARHAAELMDLRNAIVDVPDITELDTTAKELRGTARQTENLERSLQLMLQSKQAAEQLAGEAEQLHQGFHTLTKGIQCPLCHQKMS